MSNPLNSPQHPNIKSFFEHIKGNLESQTDIYGRSDQVWQPIIFKGKTSDKHISDIATAMPSVSPRPLSSSTSISSNVRKI